MKTAREYWIYRFGIPETDSDKLAIIMMSEYYEYASKANTTTDASTVSTTTVSVSASKCNHQWHTFEIPEKITQCPLCGEIKNK